MIKRLIHCQNLVKVFDLDGVEHQALQGLNITIEQGELMAIVGASGSGKSTLMNILGGLIQPTSGKATVNGQDLSALAGVAQNQYRQQEVGFVWQQSSRNLIPYLNVRENVEYPMLLAGQDGRQVQERAEALLTLVDLSHRMDHKLPMLSGGEQQRAAIAVALANNPSILLADEPTGELDTVTSLTIYKAFQTLNKEKGLTILIVSHDPGIAQHVDRVVTIRDGKLWDDTAPVETAVLPQTSPLTDAAQLLHIPEQEFTTFFEAYGVEVSVAEQGVMITPVTAVKEENIVVAETAVSSAPQAPKPSAAIVQSRSDNGTPANVPAIDVHNINRIYNPGPQQVVALDDLSLTIEPGQFVALKGRSGSGKTTLLNCLGALDKPSSGTIEIFGERLAGLSARQLAAWRRKNIGFIFQAYGLLPMLSAYENVELMLRIAIPKEKQRKQHALDYLALVGLAEHVAKRPYELSGGQLQRVAIARALANQPRLILADEATGELDSETGKEILALFRTIARDSGITILLATHDPQVDDFVDQVLNMRDGQIAGEI